MVKGLHGILTILKIYNFFTAYFRVISMQSYFYCCGKVDYGIYKRIPFVKVIYCPAIFFLLFFMVEARIFLQCVR